LSKSGLVKGLIATARSPLGELGGGELIKGTSVLMILMELMVLTPQSFIIKEGWFCKKEDDGGGYYIRL
jgi:hypothetical protein